MGTIHRPWYSGSGGTEAADFIQCINGKEPLIHELWCLGLNVISRKVHPTARVEVPDGSVRERVTNYLAKNRRQIEIIEKNYVNNSVQFMGLYNQAWGSGLLRISNLLVHVDSTGWGSSNNSNQKKGGQFNNANIITNFAWRPSVDAHTDYLPCSPVNTCASRTTSLVAGVKISCGANIIGAIPWSTPLFIGRGMTGMVR